MKYRASIFLSALLVLAFAGPQLSAQQGVIIERVLVKVNGEIFSQKQLEDRQVNALRDKGVAKPTPQDIEGVTPDILVAAVDEMLIVQRGKELGFHATDQQFKDYIDHIKADNKLNDAEFKVAMSQEGLTLDSLRENFEKQVIMKGVQEKEILAHLNLTEEEARQYYDKHPNEFMKPATVMMREILITVPADTTTGGGTSFRPNVEEAAKEKIIAARERALKGEDFAKIVADVSDAPSKATGGLIGPVNVAEMSTGIRDVIEKMKPGEITQPIRTTRGFQIFKLESRTAAEREAFQNVRDQIGQRIGEERLDVEMKKYLATLRTQALIEWKRDDLRQMYEKRIAEAK
jgi:peptidyl-prolyl cis-trans isomerase SurA